MGVGALSCGKWIAASENRKFVIVNWVDGFVGSYNWYRQSNKKKQIGSPDLETISMWMTTFCKKNPTKATVAAAAALVEQLGGEATQFEWEKVLR